MRMCVHFINLSKKPHISWAYTWENRSSALCIGIILVREKMSFCSAKQIRDTHPWATHPEGTIFP